MYDEPKIEFYFLLKNNALDTLISVMLTYVFLTRIDLEITTNENKLIYFLSARVLTSYDFYCKVSFYNKLRQFKWSKHALSSLFYYESYT